MVTIWFPYVGVACSSGGHSPPGRDNTKGAGKTGLQVGFKGNFENTVFQGLNKSAWLLDKPIWAVFWSISLANWGMRFPCLHQVSSYSSSWQCCCKHSKIRKIPVFSSLSRLSWDGMGGRVVDQQELPGLHKWLQPLREIILEYMNGY